MIDNDVLSVKMLEGFKQ